MATYVSGVLRPTGPLHYLAKARLGNLGPVVAEFDGWHTATALALFHLAEIGHGEVLIVTARRPGFFRLPPGWSVQEPGLCAPIYRCQRALWLGPLEIAPLGSEALWPCFAERRNPRSWYDKGPDLDPDYPDYSGLGPDHPLRWSSGNE